MAYSEKPSWLEAAVNRFSRGHQLIGARNEDLSKFYDSIIYQLIKMEEPKEKGRSIVDIDTKELYNIKGQEDDKFTIKTQKKNSTTTSKNYNLKLGTCTTFGGEGGLSLTPNFFNIGVGVSAKGSASRTKTKEQTAGESSERSLSQEYGIDGEVKAPPYSKLHVRIVTYAVTYESKVTIRMSTRSSNFIPVRVRRAGCVGSCFGSLCGNTIFITAKQALQQLQDNPYTEADDRDGWVQITTTAGVQYIGETTEIKKDIIDDITDI